MRIRIYMYILCIICVPCNISSAYMSEFSRVHIIGYIQDGDDSNCSMRFSSILTGLVGTGHIPNNRANIICMQDRPMTDIWKYISAIECPTIKFEKDAFWDMGWEHDEPTIGRFESVVGTNAIDMVVVCGDRSAKLVTDMETSTKFMVINYTDTGSKRETTSNIHITIEPDFLTTQLNMCSAVVDSPKFIIISSDTGMVPVQVGKFKHESYIFGDSPELSTILSSLNGIVETKDPKRDIFVLMNFPIFDRDKSNRRALIAHLKSFGYLVISHNGIEDVSCGADFGLGPNSYVIDTMDYFGKTFTDILVSENLRKIPNTLKYDMKIGVNLVSPDNRLHPIYNIANFVYRDTNCRF